LSDHLIFELRGADRLAEVLQENNFEVSRQESDVTETESQVDVLVVFDQVLDRQVKGVESVSYDIDTEASCGGDGDGVGVDSSESFLINGVLAESWGDLLLSVVSHKVVLEGLVHNKNWFQMMNIFSLNSLSENISFWDEISG
jgi:hypothetical protein